MSYNPTNPFPPLSDRNERTLRAVPVNERWVPVAELPNWAADGACVGKDPNQMFPDNGGQSKAARKLCSACSVRGACLTTAMEDPGLTGIWGGTSKAERDFRREAAKKAARAEALRIKRAKTRAARATRHG